MKVTRPRVADGQTVFYAYRAQDDESYHFENVNAANLAGRLSAFSARTVLESFMESCCHILMRYAWPSYECLHVHARCWLHASTTWPVLLLSCLCTWSALPAHSTLACCDTAGILLYLHHEVIEAGSCPRKFGITRILRFRIVMHNAPVDTWGG